MNIRLATKNDILELNKLFKSVIDDLKNIKKIDMLWNEMYPFCEFENDIVNKEMYIVEQENKVIGSFVLSEFDDPDYHKIEWNSKNEKFFYINRLAILPTEQGKGYAKEIIKFIEKYGVKNNYEYIRLTVYKENIYAIGLYEKMGFMKVKKGVWQLEDKKYIGYEKNLKP